MKVVFSVFLFTLFTSPAIAGGSEKALAIGLASSELEAKIDELDKTVVAKDFRGWGHLGFVSAVATHHSYSGSTCDHQDAFEYTLTYKNRYGTAQKATLNLAVIIEVEGCKENTPVVEVEFQGIIETNEAILK